MVEPQYLALVGAFQGLFLVIVSLARAFGRGGFILALAPSVLTMRLVLHVLFGVDLPTFHPATLASSASLFLLGPLLRAYVVLVTQATSAQKSNVRDDWQISSIYWFVHFIPAITVFLLLSISNEFFLHRLLGYALYVHVPAYIVPAILRVRLYRASVRKRMPFSARFHLDGTIRMLIAMLIILVVSAVGDLLVGFEMEPEWYPWIPIVVVVLLLFLATYVAIVRPDTDRPIIEGEKYSKNRLGDTVERRILEQLETAMKEKELYKEMELRLSDLSAAVGIAPQTASMILNLQRGENFYRFVNRYRVEAVISDMKKGKNRDRLLIEIAMENGFRSKSTFNQVFREMTGLTPSEFRVEQKK